MVPILEFGARKSGLLPSTEEGSIGNIKTASTSEGNTKITGTNHLVHEKSIHDTGNEMHVTSTAVMETFQELKASIDYYISQYKLTGYSDSVIPKQTEMCIVHILDAFRPDGVLARRGPARSELGARSIPPARMICRLYLQCHSQNGGLIHSDGIHMTRSDISLPQSQRKLCLRSFLKRHLTTHMTIARPI